MSPSKPLCLCSNFTIGTLAVVMGKMFLKPVMLGEIIETANCQSQYNFTTFWFRGHSGLKKTQLTCMLLQHFCKSFDDLFAVQLLFRRREICHSGRTRGSNHFSPPGNLSWCEILVCVCVCVCVWCCLLPLQFHDPPESCRCQDHCRGNQSHFWRSRRGRAELYLLPWKQKKIIFSLEFENIYFFHFYTK